MRYQWHISEELTGDNHIVIDTGKSGCVLIERHIKGHDQDDMPMAYLIAAAPDLLEACKLIEYWLADANVCCFPRSTLHAAIAKAEGREVKEHG